MSKFFSENLSLEDLIGFIDGTADNDKKREVEAWIEKDNSNRLLFHRLKEIWDHPGELRALDQYTVMEDWKLILEKINSKHREYYRKTLFKSHFQRYPGWIKVAAFTVLVTLVAAMALFTIYTLGDKQDMAYNTISVPNGQRSEITLSDGTRILINAGSSLRFPEQFQRKDREVFLDGEAYFEVSEKKSRPFCVHTEDITIRVTGTVFNVEAYAGDGYVVTTLVSGKVQLWNNYAKRGQKETVNLKPMQQAVFLKNNNAKINQAVVKHFQNTLTPGKIISSQLMDIDPFVSWTEGKLSFENETFGNLARKLERRYGVNIEIQDESLKQIRFTGVLKNISVEQAMKALQLTARFHIDMRDNVIIIHPYGSNKTKIQ